MAGQVSLAARSITLLSPCMRRIPESGTLTDAVGLKKIQEGCLHASGDTMSPAVLRHAGK
jgi:hypothetical protein